MENMKTSNDKEFEDLENAKDEFKEKMKNLSEKHPITDFLLSEAEPEPPEVLIVAELIKENGQMSMDDFRKETKINSSVVAKTIDSLQQKGIVSKMDKDTIRLVKRDVS
jgi:predicted HTH transcriptional regulator